ncbi:pentatricopeptide repeat-containing protein-like [Iris pallida]|uniref:Pentatricopeptide repeat-containing protein-like n=1 Tax=Iris pallida TaxID=29817 RepID=A0AAX6DRE8_IRIPA|nr:pentatricopeptide repeat-containing protein-like [Iris pallida]
MTVTGLIDDAFAASRLISFSAFADLGHSLRILHRIDSPNSFTYNTLMRAHLQKNSPQSCLSLYKSMLRSGVFPDNYTHPIALHACAVASRGPEGKTIHAHVLKLGFESDVYVTNTLISMYWACGSLRDARKVFDISPVLDSVSWNSILAAYVQDGDVDEAVHVFGRMPERNTVAANSMIALFGRSKRVGCAWELFDGMRCRDAVSWTAMISCYEQNKMFGEALGVFSEMNREGVGVDEVVMVSVLSACCRLLAVKEGMQIHGSIVRSGLEPYVNLQNALIHMYSSCWDVAAARRLFDAGGCLDQISWNSMISGYLRSGLVEDAKELFDVMPHKDLVSWSSMISGYAQHDRFSETLALFQEMQVKRIRPNESTLVSVISACIHLSALEQGKWIHTYIRKNKFQINGFLSTSLIDMYMKCGCVDTALEVFNGLEERGMSTWNAAVFGLATNGFCKESFEKFTEMENSGVVPNEVTFLGVLVACRHSGLVDKGRQYFKAMIHNYNIEPNIKHYGCMVDLLSRAGLLREAEELIKSMPMAPDVATWGALLGACKKHGENEMGERIGRKLVELEPKHDGFHVLLSNIYASKGKWDEVMELRGMMKRRRVVKVPGCSMMEFDGVVHEFLAGDSTHPRMKEIEKMLDEMASKLKEDGYEPNTTDVAFDIEEEEKESSLYRHSEKLAIAFGLISTSPPMPIRIMKNLRICSDCHAAAKIISRVFQREIVIRDRQLFHHFKQGVCSCTDYW